MLHQITKMNRYMTDLPSLTEDDIENQIEGYLKQKYSSENFEIISFEKESVTFATRSQSQELIGSTTQIRNVGYAKNQYANGVTFNGTTGILYYVDSQGSDVSMNFSIASKIVSVGIGLESKTSGVTAYGFTCAANKPCKLYVKKNVKIDLYHVIVSYERQVYSESDVPVKKELQLYLSNGLA